MDKDLEKKIEEAARIRSKLKEGFDVGEERYYNSQALDNYHSFIEGAKSFEAKEYWQQGMYTEEEVKALLNKYLIEQCASKWDYSDDEWFEQNKKK